MPQKSPKNKAPAVHCNCDKMVPIGSMVPHPRNPNTHSTAQIELLAKIIAGQGWRSPVVVSKRSGFVVAGHARLKAAERLGLDSVPVNVQVFKTEADEWAHLVADNRIAELAEMDNAALKELLLEMDTGEMDMDFTGYDHDALEELMTQFHVDEEPVDAEPQIDKADELAEKWGTKLGQVWELGDHRIACGDSTAPETLAKLMGEEKSDLVFTDPPYGIGYEYSSFDDVQGGEYLDFCEKWWTQIAGEDCIIITTGWKYLRYWWNKSPTDCLYWFCKNKTSGGKASFLRKVEPIFVFGNMPNKYGEDYFEVLNDYHNEVKGLHSCPKPLRLISCIIEPQSRRGDLVLDIFLGSGTTLMACENLGRKCRGIELSPSYVAVTLERWHEATGKEPRLI